MAPAAYLCSTEAECELAHTAVNGKKAALFDRSYGYAPPKGLSQNKRLGRESPECGNNATDESGKVDANSGVLASSLAA